MKVFSCPKEVPAPQVDYRNYDHKKVDADEKSHMEQLRLWLRKSGYTGKYTGEVLNVQIADGYARYMMADGSKSCLIHLPYGDAYDSRDVAFLPKKEVIRRIESRKAFASMWTEKIS